MRHPLSHHPTAAPAAASRRTLSFAGSNITSCQDFTGRAHGSRRPLRHIPPPAHSHVTVLPNMCTSGRAQVRITRSLCAPWFLPRGSAPGEWVGLRRTGCRSRAAGAAQYPPLAVLHTALKQRRHLCQALRRIEGGTKRALMFNREFRRICVGFVFRASASCGCPHPCFEGGTNDVANGLLHGPPRRKVPHLRAGRRTRRARGASERSNEPRCRDRRIQRAKAKNTG